MTPQLTKAATGRTICPGCGKRFANTPGPIMDMVGWEENRGHFDSAGYLHRGIGTHDVVRRWHVQCVTDFEAANEAYRKQAEEDRWNDIRAICEAHGLDFEEQKARLLEGTRS